MTTIVYFKTFPLDFLTLLDLYNLFQNISLNSNLILNEVKIIKLKKPKTHVIISLLVVAFIKGAD
ncbi:hypothetical protein GCM10007096_15470 [Pullulanibacillus pueri]|uniref:Uncharacterized protein n=1 Tax=Pullulanibacillus pueri TaxID=1437324 RepID=A0A8J2ZVU5_9BACL|nr:hypothetical protein GCM10007096_15470 [Pullulanibacillus pueri]